jgi:hypothetical protein
MKIKCLHFREVSNPIDEGIDHGKNNTGVSTVVNIDRYLEQGLFPH